MIVGVGIDLVELDRIRSVYERHQQRFLDRILTPAEKQYVTEHADPIARLSGRWAAKEAGLKALGTGLAEGIGWRDIEVLPDERGKPILYLHNKGAERARLMEANIFHVTITHSQGLAMAQVILERV